MCLGCVWEYFTCVLNVFFMYLNVFEMCYKCDSHVFECVSISNILKSNFQLILNSYHSIILTDRIDTYLASFVVIKTFCKQKLDSCAFEVTAVSL